MSGFICRVLFFLLVGESAWGASLWGVVRGEANEVLPYATVYVEGAGIGTTTNQEGKYVLPVPGGRHRVTFQHIGYQKQVVDVVLHHDEKKRLDVVLKKESFELAEITVLAAAEDPAYEIIRKAQRKRRFYRDQVEAYSCKVYIKGLQRLNAMPERIMGLSLASQGIDSSLIGIVYMSESESAFHFQRPNQIKEIVYSSRRAGNNSAFTWNTATAFSNSFYDNVIALEGVTPRGLVSPIAEGAMLFYRYRLLGSFYEDGLLINKIEIIPRRDHDPVFRGILYVVEDWWCIHSLDLIATRAAQIEFVDSLRFQITYRLINDTAWMPISQLLQFRFSVMGFQGDGYFLGVFSDYNLAPQFTPQFFDQTLITISADANEKDSIYWATQRPVPLTDEEQKSYRQKDSLYVLRQSKAYLDSMDRLRNRWHWEDMLLGYRYQRSYHKLFITWHSPIVGLGFNAVEGFNVTVRTQVEKELTRYREWNGQIALRYGFGNQQAGIEAGAAYRQQAHRHQTWQMAVGRFPVQFNEQRPISEWLNTLYALVAHIHHLKLYEHRFVRFGHEREWIDGWMVQSSLQWSDRLPLFNTTDYSFGWLGDPPFEANTFFDHPQVDTFYRSQAMVAEIRANITPGQTYMVRPDRRIGLGSRWPTLFLRLRKALAVAGGDERFGLIETGLQRDWILGLAGKFNVAVNGGVFFTSRPSSFVDFRHFLGNQTLVGMHYTDGFQLLPYYRYSTNHWWVQGHYEHHWRSWLFNKIPVIKKLKLQEVTGLHVLVTPDVRYAEAAVGIENIGKVVRLDYVFNVTGQLQKRHGIRIGLLLAAGR